MLSLNIMLHGLVILHYYLNSCSVLMLGKDILVDHKFRIFLKDGKANNGIQFLVEVCLSSLLNVCTRHSAVPVDDGM